MGTEVMPFLPISRLDLDLQARIKDAPLTSLREFHAALVELQGIQEKRWGQGLSA